MERRNEREQLMNAAEEETTAQALSEALGTEALEPEEDENEAQEERAGELREGIGKLFEDGWTLEELRAFSLDEQAQTDVAQGKSVERAACGYLRRLMQERGKRHGVPTTRATAAGEMPEENRIERMSDAQFREFSRKAHAAMMAGKKVRI